MHLSLCAVGHVGVGLQPPCHMGMVSVQIGWIKAALCWSLLNIGGEGATAVLWKREQLSALWALSVDLKYGSVSNPMTNDYSTHSDYFIYYHGFILFLIVEICYFLFFFLHWCNHTNFTAWNSSEFRSGLMFTLIFTHVGAILIKARFHLWNCPGMFLLGGFFFPIKSWILNQ